MDIEPSESRRSAATAVGVAGLAIAAAIATLIVHARNAAALGEAAELFLADVWIMILVPPVGAYLIVRGRQRLLGSILLSTALLAIGGLAGTTATFLTAVRGEAGVAAVVLTWVATWTWTPYLALPTLVPMLFPDGRTTSRRWSTVAGAIAAGIGLITVLSAFMPGPLEPFPLISNPIGGPAWIASVLGLLIPMVLLLGSLLALVSVFVRWTTAGREHRHDIGWLLAAVAVLVVSVLSQDRLPYPWSDVAVAGGFTAVVAAVAVATATERTASELRRSREQLVVAREAERQRLHRDLHDGLGPELAGMALQLHAIGSKVDDPELRSHLGRAEATMRNTVAEVRRIVEDLRPPALDELGLVGAITERAHALSVAGTPRIAVEATEQLGDLPPAVEVAAFRIAVEALVNSVRHAQAEQCVVRLVRAGDQLHVDVVDDGTGGVSPRPGGVGLASMRQRAEEIGGRFAIGASTHGGARVQAWLPLPTA